jgi:hypothetical protein
MYEVADSRYPLFEKSSNTLTLLCALYQTFVLYYSVLRVYITLHLAVWKNNNNYNVKWSKIFWGHLMSRLYFLIQILKEMSVH